MEKCDSPCNDGSDFHDFQEGLWGTPPAAGTYADFKGHYSHPNSRVENIFEGANEPDNANGVHSYSSWDPFADAGWAEDTTFAEWFGEVHYLEDNVPGVAGNTMNFSNAKVQRKSDGQWTHYDWTNGGWFPSTGCSWMHQAQVGQADSGQFKIWTDPFSHSGCT